MARKRFNFWLDENKSDDQQIEALIQDLKRDRLFSRAIREGLKMWVETQEGSAPTASASTGNGGAGQLEEIKAMLEMIVTNQKANGGYTMHPAPALTGKPIAAPQFAMPAFDKDDDMPTLLLSKSAVGDTSVTNFMSAMGAM